MPAWGGTGDTGAHGARPDFAAPWSARANLTPRQMVLDKAPAEPVEPA